VDRKAVCLACGVWLGWGSIGATGPAAAAEPETWGLVEALGKLGVEHAPPEAFDPQDLDRRLAAKGMALGKPILIRLFKQESELEVWMDTGARFEPFATYRICNWSGKLGPKLAEGDKQSPEGLYSVGLRQLRRFGRWPRSLDIGFPNTYDRGHGRTGSLILVHGGCTSTGCFAMTDRVMEEIYRLSEAALAKGQNRIQVHAYPFRMTPENLAAHADSQWSGFWANLKEAHDLFERTRVPPPVSVCNNRYVFGEEAADDDACVANLSAGRIASTRWRSVRRFRQARLVWRHAGRNARKAHAAARVAPMAAAYAGRRQAWHAGARHRTHR
jgi:murein L,D-transpeptidase YafK